MWGLPQIQPIHRNELVKICVIRSHKSINSFFMNQSIFFLLFIGGLLFACTNSSDSQSTKATIEVETKKEKPLPVASSQLLIQDSTQYSKKFLDLLAASNYAQTFELKKGALIIDGRDTTSFPQELVFDKPYHFEGKKNNWLYQLQLQQINYTTLIYQFQRFEASQLKDDLKGQAIVNALFFLGDESDEDDQSGNTYFASEYIHDKEDCSFFIRIGRDEGDLKAKIVQYCEKESKGITLEECPTLREKNKE